MPPDNIILFTSFIFDKDFNMPVEVNKKYIPIINKDNNIIVIINLINDFLSTLYYYVLFL